MQGNEASYARMLGMRWHFSSLGQVSTGVKSGKLREFHAFDCRDQCMQSNEASHARMLGMW